MIFVGIDWASDHHDVEIQDESGKVLERFRIAADLSGLERLRASLRGDPEQVSVAIEASHGLWVNALVEGGYRVYPINPLTSARAREGEAPSRSKSDSDDAHMLANLVRTRQNLRLLAGDSEIAQAIQARARAQQRAVRLEKMQRNHLLSLLTKFYTAALPLFGHDEQVRDALAVLEVAPNPALGRRLSLSKIESALKRHGRQRKVSEAALKIQTHLREKHLELGNAELVAAYSDEVRHLVRTLVLARIEIDEFETELTSSFEKHPDAEIYRSLPGLGLVLSARVLGEFGDDPNRYPNAKARKNYAGNSPITRASGRNRFVSRRIVRNRLLADALFRAAFASLAGSPGARQYYDSLRLRQKTHNEATRALANKLTGILHGCLTTHNVYVESQAWPTQLEAAA